MLSESKGKTSDRGELVLYLGKYPSLSEVVVGQSHSCSAKTVRSLPGSMHSTTKPLMFLHARSHGRECESSTEDLTIRAQELRA